LNKYNSLIQDEQNFIVWTIGQRKRLGFINEAGAYHFIRPWEENRPNPRNWGFFENDSLLPMNDDLIRFFELNMAGKAQEEQQTNEIKNRHK